MLRDYRNVLALAGVLLLLAPRLPRISNPENGAYLSVAFGPIRFQPTELAKALPPSLPRELPRRQPPAARAGGEGRSACCRR